MFNEKSHSRMPKTVDEAAEILISDLLIQHLQTLSQMDEEDFNVLCEKVTPYLLEEFKLWEGNNNLLESCLKVDQNGNDPARVILRAVKNKLHDFSCFLLIT
jgi:hypothetical protein